MTSEEEKELTQALFSTSIWTALSARRAFEIVLAVDGRIKDAVSNDVRCVRATAGASEDWFLAGGATAAGLALVTTFKQSNRSMTYFECL